MVELLRETRRWEGGEVSKRSNPRTRLNPPDSNYPANPLQPSRNRRPLVWSPGQDPEPPPSPPGPPSLRRAGATTESQTPHRFKVGLPTFGTFFFQKNKPKTKQFGRSRQRPDPPSAAGEGSGGRRTLRERRREKTKQPTVSVLESEIDEPRIEKIPFFPFAWRSGGSLTRPPVGWSPDHASAVQWHGDFRLFYQGMTREIPQDVATIMGQDFFFFSEVTFFLSQSTKLQKKKKKVIKNYQT